MSDSTTQEDQADGEQADGQCSGPGHDPHPHGRDHTIGDYAAGEQEKKYFDIPTDDLQEAELFGQSW